jgi:hypothetical protein
MDPAVLAATAWASAAQVQLRQPIAPASRLLGVLETAAAANLPQGLVPDEAMWFADWKMTGYHESRAGRPTKTTESDHPADRFHQKLRERLQDLFPWSRSVCFGNVGG